MSVSEQRERIKRRLWQAAAQSEVDLSALSKEQQATLVNNLADNMLLELDDILTETAGPVVRDALQAPPPSAEEDAPMHEGEQVLWEGRPFLTLGIKYTITDERVRVSQGILNKARDDIELVRVQDIDYTQSLRERFLNVGDIRIRSHDPSTPRLVLNDVANPGEVHEILRRAMLGAREKQGITFQEEM